jgi:GT2 family glycosyltransferase
MSDLAVVIVNWNTRDLTLEALRSLFLDLSTPPPSSEVWVVDNASSDGSAEAIAQTFPQVNLIASTENLGFARGNNAALLAMGFSNTPQNGPPPPDLPQAVYLLNSDTLTQPGASGALYEALMTLPGAGVVGARLFYGDGSFQHSAFRFPGLAQLWIDLLPHPARLYESAWNGRYPQATYEAGRPFPIDHPLGATMMLKREAIWATGLFDERFHMYCEEIDWSWRIQRAGWRLYCVPAARVVHYGGQSTGQVRARSVVNLWRARLQLFHKYYPPWKLSLAKGIIRAGMRRKLRGQTLDLNLELAYQEVIRLTEENL